LGLALDSYLDSISTYMFKLGADHLPPGFDGPVDRKVAAAPHVADDDRHAGPRERGEAGDDSVVGAVLEQAALRS
jgi:hypothetical protein